MKSYHSNLFFLLVSCIATISCGCVALFSDINTDEHFAKIFNMCCLSVWAKLKERGIKSRTVYKMIGQEAPTEPISSSNKIIYKQEAPNGATQNILGLT